MPFNMDVFVHNYVDSLFKRVLSNFNVNLVQLKTLLLNNPDPLRVFVSASPGMGHQTSTVNIMMQLINIQPMPNGIEVYYDPGVLTVGDPDNTFGKLQKLIPGLNNQVPPIPAPNATVDINGVVVNFIPLTPVDSVYPPVATGPYRFGITGGIDGGKINFANILNVNIFLTLLPFQWNSPANGFWRLNGTFTNFNNIAGPPFNGVQFAAKAGYVTPLPTRADALASLTGNAKAQAYQDIITALETGSINLCPIYGITNQVSVGVVSPHIALFNLISGILDAQIRGNPSNKKGAVIVVMDSTTKVDYAELNQIIAGTSAALTGYDALKQYITANITGKVDYCIFNDGTLNEKLTAIQQNPKAVLIVAMEGIPQAAFNYLYYVATLPSIFEGKGTENTVLNYGKSYLQLNGQAALAVIKAFPKYPATGNITTPKLALYPTLPFDAAANCNEAENSFKCTMQLRVKLTVWNDFLTANNAVDNPNLPSVQIGMFIYFSSDDTHQLAKYYESLGYFFHDEVNDKLLEALFYVVSQGALQ